MTDMHVGAKPKIAGLLADAVEGARLDEKSAAGSPNVADVNIAKEIDTWRAIEAEKGLEEFLRKRKKDALESDLKVFELNR